MSTPMKPAQEITDKGREVVARGLREYLASNERHAGEECDAFTDSLALMVSLLPDPDILVVVLWGTILEMAVEFPDEEE